MEDLALAFNIEPAPRPGHAPTAAIALLETFARHGVRVAFGIPGGTASPLFDGLLDVPDIVFVATRHEAMAGFAACGHARVTGMPALVLTTSGPGLTNAITGMAAAALEELPVIFLSGEVASTAVARGALQDGSAAGLDVLNMVRSMTRWATTLSSAVAAQSVAERAWDMATGPRPGPVYIGVPLDIGGQSGAKRVFSLGSRVSADPGPLACGEAAHRLQNSRRPLLLLGNGSRGAAPEARALAERLAIPVAVTGHAKGVFPETHPLYLGIIGVGQHPSVTSYLAISPDVVCIVGSRMGEVATNGWTLPLAGTTATIQIDRDPVLLGCNVSATLAIVGDAGSALREMAQSLADDVAVPSRTVSGCISHRPELAKSDTIPLKPQRVLSSLSEAFPGAIWCSDIGEHLTMALHYLRIDEPLRFHAMTGLGAMGSGIGSAIGIKHALPDATVVAVCGDGGLAMHAGELLTCVENRIGVVFAVFNDGRWNMIHHGFRTVYGRLPPSLPARVADLAAVAKGFGAVSAVVGRPEDLRPERLRRLASSGLPVVLDIRIDGRESLTSESRAATIRHLARPQVR